MVQWYGQHRPEGTNPKWYNLTRICTTCTDSRKLESPYTSLTICHPINIGSHESGNLLFTHTQNLFVADTQYHFDKDEIKRYLTRWRHSPP